MAYGITGMNRYDVAIVGSGPAGMSAAMSLKGHGLDVIVIERLSDIPFSRYHSVCGEAVSDGIFRKLGWKPDSIVADVSTLRISYPGGLSIDVPVKGRIVDRPGMLREIKGACDAEFIQGSVVAVDRDAEDHILSMSDGGIIRCRYLIGADGAHSVVRRDVFHMGPTERIPVINCIAEGDGSDVLAFTVEGRFSGVYSWHFPSSPGRVSIGFPKGCDDPHSIPGLIQWGARDLPFGVLERVVDGNCMLVGDAACLANPLCYGGIGAAMLSGKEAAGYILKGKPEGYQDWVSRNPMFDRRFMDAHEKFTSWSDAEIEDAMVPFRGGYYLVRGMYAMIRRPRWASVYMAIYMGLKHGW